MRARLVQVECDDCKYNFVMTSDRIQTEMCEIKNEKYSVMFFVCPNCSKVSVIAIKDSNCIRLTNEISDLQFRISKLLKIDKSKAEQLKIIKMNKQIKLGRKIDRFNKLFDGEFEFSNNKLSYRGHTRKNLEE